MQIKSTYKLLNSLTKEQLETLRKNYETNDALIQNDQNTIDFEVVVKFFNPTGIGTWYLTELSPNNIGFGICHLQEVELGYVCLEELASLKETCGLEIENDCWFSAQGHTISDLYKRLKSSESIDFSESTETLHSTRTLASPLQSLNRITQNDLLRKAQSFVDKNILSLQDQLVNTCFVKGVFDIEEIVNLFAYYDQDDERLLGKDLKDAMNKDNFYDNCREETREIFNWYLITDWLSQKFIEKGEPVLKNEYGIWWGRTCTGQALVHDSVIQDIVQDLS